VNAPQFPERWVRLYTVGLPLATREERRDEIASDVYDQCSSNGDASARGVRAAIVGRTLRGVPGDFMWRIEEGHAMKQQRRAALGRPSGFHAAWATVTQSWFTPLAVLLGIFDLVAAVLVFVDPNGKMPGQVIGPLFLVGFACSMFTGLWLRWRAQFGGTRAPRARRSPVSGTSLLVGAGVVTVALVVLGAMTSPLPLVVGLAVLVVLVAIGAAVLRRRAAAGHGMERASEAPFRGPSWVADGLIVAGTLPALGIFWLVVPAILALVVIGGVIGTQPGTKRESRVAA
jgi:hypothetical protein